MEIISSLFAKAPGKASERPTISRGSPISRVESKENRQDFAWPFSQNEKHAAHFCLKRCFCKHNERSDEIVD
jgi:hypothetical protein